MIEWQWYRFSELSNRELYDILAARSEVFVVEQQSIYLDSDGKDIDALHLCGWKTIAGQRRLGAYLRLLRPGVKYEEASIGRVLTTSVARGSGTGREMVRLGIERSMLEYPVSGIRISAQEYLVPFYSGFGFAPVSEQYDEDGIPHREMFLSPLHDR